MRCCIAPKIVYELSSTILPKKYHCNAQRENCFSLMLENVKKSAQDPPKIHGRKSTAMPGCEPALFLIRKKLQRPLVG